MDDTPEKVESNIQIAQVEFIETGLARIDYSSLGALAGLDWRWRGGISVAVDHAGVVILRPEYTALWAPECLHWPD